MDIARMRPVEFFKDPGQGFFAHPYTIIFYPDTYIFSSGLGGDLYYRRHIFPAVLNGIINQVAQHIGEMNFISFHNFGRGVQLQ